MARASQKEWLYWASNESFPMENTHCGTFMVVEKAAMEQKMKAAVASIMYPAYRMTGMQRRMLASSQQKNAVLEGGEKGRTVILFSKKYLI